METSEIVERLFAAGVEDWEGYDEAIRGLTPEEVDDEETILVALESAGVDNWEGYEIALHS